MFLGYPVPHMKQVQSRIHSSLEASQFFLVAIDSLLPSRQIHPGYPSRLRCWDKARAAIDLKRTCLVPELRLTLNAHSYLSTTDMGVGLPIAFDFSTNLC